MNVLQLLIITAAQVPLTVFIAKFFFLMEEKSAILVQGKPTDALLNDFSFTIGGLVVSAMISFSFTSAVLDAVIDRRRKEKAAAALNAS